jgi:hypothetical protein
MAVGVTPLVRASRAPTTPPVEHHVIRESRLHTIDNRQSPPGAHTRQTDMYPGLHSAEWRAGLLDDRRDHLGAQVGT